MPRIHKHARAESDLIEIWTYTYERGGESSRLSGILTNSTTASDSLSGIPSSADDAIMSGKDTAHSGSIAMSCTTP